MKYATWILNFANTEYGTGPESSIVSQGGSAEGAWVNGDITSGGAILGYFTGEPVDLEAWSFTELTQDEALSFVLSIDPTAYVGEDGKIKIEITGEN